ncbi:hypothetical protein BH20BAC1_BH20BAC1_08210 [soil metagenome]
MSFLYNLIILAAIKFGQHNCMIIKRKLLPDYANKRLIELHIAVNQPLTSTLKPLKTVHLQPMEVYLLLCLR